MDHDTLLIWQSYMACRSLPERWKVLRPIISELYVDKDLTLREVMERIQRQFGFDANERQYKYKINRQWKLKKYIPASAKRKMLQVYEVRKGKSTALDYQGRLVDKKRLARLARSQAVDPSRGQKLKNKDKTTSPATRQGVKLNISPRIFLKWNMPYDALQFSRTGPIDHTSPHAVILSPAGEIKVYTPSANNALSPPADSPSGLSRALWNKTRLERAYLFMQGEHDELLRSMEKEERVVMVTWLYQFWLFAYKTARFWGKGPRNWTKGLLELDKYMAQLSIPAPGTPSSTGASPVAMRTGAPASSWLMDGITPSILCNWSVHIPFLQYECIPTPDLDDSDNDGPSPWKDWPKSYISAGFVEKLRNALRNNHFSNIDEDNLPVALPRLLEYVNLSENDLLEEGLAFSIMGRNVPLLFSLTRKIKCSKVSIDGLYPFHLATSYLSGADPCCNVVCGLLYQPLTFPISEAYVNERGHTVLDNLMLAIIKSHTKCVPGDIDGSMRQEARFVGEEVDICGRWDADSDEIRSLLSTGASRIPIEWKHKLCHTSTQVICHCISLIFGAEWRPDINHVSGLFKKVCQYCNVELKLLPLHTIVLIAFQLGQQGYEEEDLFGIIACLLCLLWKGANPILKADLPAPELFGGYNVSGCSHQSLDPFQLANRLPTHLYRSWSPGLQTGWNVMCHILKLSQKVWQPDLRQESQGTPVTYHFGQLVTYPDDAIEMDWTPETAMGIGGRNNRIREEENHDDDENSFDDEVHHCHECGNRNYFRGSTVLRDLWAAAQAEFLTYRRLRDGDRWTSSNFDMTVLLENLERGDAVGIGLINRHLLRKYCDCGRFALADDEDCPCVDDVCTEYFSNLEEWERTNCIACPEKCWQNDYIDSDEYGIDSDEENEYSEKEGEYDDDEGEYDNDKNGEEEDEDPKNTVLQSRFYLAGM